MQGKLYYQNYICFREGLLFSPFKNTDYFSVFLTVFLYVFGIFPDFNSLIKEKLIRRRNTSCLRTYSPQPAAQEVYMTDSHSM